MLTFVRQNPWTTASIALVAAAVLFVSYLIAGVYPQRPIIQPDSWGYLNFSWHRSVGYPLFVTAIYQATGNLFVVVPIQAALVIASVVFFFYQVGRYFDRLPLALIAAAAFILNSTVIYYTYYIGTESVFTTLVLFASGAFFWALRTAHRGAMLICSVAAACAVTVKPVGIALLVFPLMLLVQCRDRRRTVVAYGLLPWFAIFLAFTAYNTITLGSPSPFLRGGMSLFAGTAHLHERGSTTADYAPVVDELAVKTTQYRSAQNMASSYRERQKIKRTQHAKVGYARNEFKGLKPLLDRLWAANPTEYCAGKVRAPSSEYFGGPHPRLCRDRLQREIAIHAIETDPVGYAVYVLDNFSAYFLESFNQQKLGEKSFYNKRHQKKAREIASDFYLNAPREHFTESEPVNAVPTISAIHLMRSLEWFGLILGFGVIATAVLMLIAVPTAIATHRRLSRLAVGAGGLSLAIAGSYLMMSLTHHIVSRYTHPFQPVLLVAGVLGLVLVSSIIAQRLRHNSWSWAPLLDVGTENIGGSVSDTRERSH